MYVYTFWSTHVPRLTENSVYCLTKYLSCTLPRVFKVHVKTRKIESITLYPSGNCLHEPSAHHRGSAYDE
jgi:hypothetical protein